MTSAIRTTSAVVAAGFTPPTDVTRMNTSQIAAMTATQLRALSADNVRAMTAMQVAALKPASLAGLTTTQVNLLGTAQIAAFTPTQMAALGSTQLAAFDVTDIGALRTIQLAALSGAGMKGIGATSLAAMTTTQINSLSTSAIAAMSSTQIGALNTVAISALTTTQIRALTASNLNALSDAQELALGVSALTTRQIGGLDVTSASNLSTTQLTSLAATQISALTISAAAALSATQVSALSVPQLNALKATTVGEAGGLQIKLLWANSTSRAPGGFREAVLNAARSFTQDFSNPVKINFQVGFGETNNKRIASGAVAQTMAQGTVTNYATVRRALLSDVADSEFETTAESTLGANDPTNGGRFFVNTAQAKVLGLLDPAYAKVDGYIGLSSQLPMDFTQSGAAGKFDAVGAMKHEISEVLGRTASVGSGFGYNLYTSLDLFRYKSVPGQADAMRSLRPGTDHDYFSIDGGATNLGNFNATSGSADFGDWNASEPGDAYGLGMPGIVATTPARDLIVMAAIGYNFTARGLAAARGQSTNTVA